MTNLSAESLADRYDEIMAFRREAFEKYPASIFSGIRGPSVHISVPSVRRIDDGMRGRQIGPFHINDNPPTVSAVDRVLASAQRKLNVLEIGPGRGELATRLTHRYADRIEQYYALERDTSVSGPYVRCELIGDVPHGIDLVIASEVIEHLTCDDFVNTIAGPLRSKLAPKAVFVASTPNPTAPGGIARDFTHVQGYPWYDLYALFRVFFDDVAVYRTYYIFDPRRALLLAPRFILCQLMELEWCEGLLCVASRPRR